MSVSHSWQRRAIVTSAKLNATRRRCCSSAAARLTTRPGEGTTPPSMIQALKAEEPLQSDPFAAKGSPVGLACRVHTTPEDLVGSQTMDRLTEVPR